MTPREARCLKIIEAAALAGQRCPFNSESGGPEDVNATLLGGLARAGQVRIEISNRNWRTVVLLRGDHKGKHTATDPSGAHAWKIVGLETRINGRCVSRGDKNRQQPSKPREIF